MNSKNNATRERLQHSRADSESIEFLNAPIVSRSQSLPTTQRNFFCAHHSTARAVILLAVRNLASSGDDFRPLCTHCFERIRNVFCVLRAEAGERRAA